jgi:predicted GIY-YIG superfamily endonuclease
MNRSAALGRDSERDGTFCHKQRVVKDMFHLWLDSISGHIPKEDWYPLVKTRQTNLATREGNNTFVPYQSSTVINLTTFGALFALAQKPLSKGDIGRGYIYMYWNKENFGLIKIGYTTDLKKRLKQHSYACKDEFYYHQETKNLPEVAHVKRVEDLIHTELKDVGRRLLCKCGKKHREWFETSPALVEKIFDKWKDWLKEEPYAIATEGVSGTLKDGFYSGLSKVCKPVVLEEDALKPGPRSKQRDRSSSRRRSKSRPRSSLVSGG